MLGLLALSAAALASAQNLPLGPTVYTAPGVFPTAAFASYYNDPTATSAQPQPIITNPITNYTYPYNLTNPDTIPGNNTVDAHVLPPSYINSTTAHPLVVAAFNQIVEIANLNNTAWGNSTCTRCVAGLEVGKSLALVAPQVVPDLMIELCVYFKFSTNCAGTYANNTLGTVITQVLAAADVAGYDGPNICNYFINSYCPLPPTAPLNLTGYFAKPKPANATAPTPSGERVKVLHLSDFHLDPRYATGSEANCTSGLCCRANNVNTATPNHTLSLAAPRYGYFDCDTPYNLALASLTAIPQLTGTNGTGFAWTVYTGDLVSHDPDTQLSQDYINYHEVALYGLYKKYLGSGPVYAVLGNHDSYNQAQDAPAALGTQLDDPALSTQFSWNYDTLANLWEYEGWIDSNTSYTAKSHYSAYSVSRSDGLRIITLNTDLWYHANYFNFINSSTSDPSGMLRFVADELQEAEDAGQRAWVLGHVLSGWDGTNPMNNPTNLFYQIIDRYSPHVVAATFWGHTHEDQFMIYYANNGTNASAETAQTVGWIVPSITPLTNLNSGFRLYEVDSKSFDILDAHTWYTDVNAFHNLDNQTAVGPTYHYEYSTREAYGTNITGWGPNDPLNATWWHRVTEQFEQYPALVQQFTTYQGKTSVLSPNCTNEACVAAKICYMRSGSASLAKQNCGTGFGSVQ